jgi:hypothetical protein
MMFTDIKQIFDKSYLGHDPSDGVAVSPNQIQGIFSIPGIEALGLFNDAAPYLKDVLTPLNFDTDKKNPLQRFDAITHLPIVIPGTIVQQQLVRSYLILQCSQCGSIRREIVKKARENNAMDEFDYSVRTFYTVSSCFCGGEWIASVKRF